MKRERRAYKKPVVKKNQPITNITFASGASAPGTGGVAGPALAF